MGVQGGSYVEYGYTQVVFANIMGSKTCNDPNFTVVVLGYHEYNSACGHDGREEYSDHSSFKHSLDWFKGTFTGTPPHISWENLWFPLDFPLNQAWLKHRASAMNFPHFEFA